MVFFTICSKNYLSFAKTLIDSLAEVHPEIDRYVLLADKKDDSLPIDLGNSRSYIVWVEDLGIPYIYRMAFNYNITEFNTSVKPYFIRYLFDMGYSKIIYLDPDIYVYRSLMSMFDLLDDNNMLLTPHITQPIQEDGFTPDELHILKSGIYNLGFIALRKCMEIDKFIFWWMERLSDKCFMDHANGIFVDQRWIDFAPVFYRNVLILEAKGYNVAYWNLHERLPIIFDASGPWTCGEPLYFYHFSGVDMFDINSISKYQNRFTINSDAGLKALFSNYRERILGNNYRILQDIVYGFDYFDNGRNITSLTRTAFRSISTDVSSQSNPFIISSQKSFYRHIRANNIKMILKNIIIALESIIYDLKRLFGCFSNKY